MLAREGCDVMSKSNRGHGHRRMGGSVSRLPCLNFHNFRVGMNNSITLVDGRMLVRDTSEGTDHDLGASLQGRRCFLADAMDGLVVHVVLVVWIYLAGILAWWWHFSTWN